MNFSTHKKSEVELRVAQELKNNQEFIYQTNQSLQNLNQAIIQLSLQNEKILNKFESDKTALKSAFESLNNDVLEHFRACRSIIKDIADDQEKVRDFVFKKVEEFKSTHAEKEIVSVCFEVLKTCHDQLLIDFAKLKDFVTTNHDLIRGRIDESMKVLRKELTPIASETDPFHSDICDKIKAMYVDFEGLKKEIAILKRSAFYEEKKFEYLNTQIERLKAE